MKIGKLSGILFLFLLWILITNYKFFPINTIGSLLNYKSGLLGIKSSDQIQSKMITGKELEIKIDAFGIPYIYSNDDDNLAYGLGYMHAKDRYFQMELMSKMVKGELASILGQKVVRSDKFWKPFEFDRKSKEIIEEYKTNSPKLYSYLVNYNEGVNAYLEQNQLNDPLYTIFGLKPQKWKPEYCLLTAWYMSSNLAYFDYHAERQELIDELPEEILGILYPQQFDDLKTILPSTDQESITPQTSTIAHVSIGNRKIDPSIFNKDVGSNNWVVNSKKADGNHALIANDPHLFLTLPGAFYEASLIGDKLKVYGYSIPGLPIIVSGHNTNISWGITNGEWDLTDRYLLKTKNDSLYFYEGNWIPFQQKKYVINVRGKGKVEVDVKRTIHGIVQKVDTSYYAQHWYPSGKNYSINSLFNLMSSTNYDEFKTALKTYDYPPQNFVYADVNDTIGMVCAGKLPKKPRGYQGGLLDGTKGLLKEEYISTQWEISNPSNNYLFSANQLPIQNDEYFGAHWHKDDYRVDRINQLLDENNDWNVNTTKSMQLDEVDFSFYHAQKVFKKHLQKDSMNAIDSVLTYWNGDMKSSSKEALLYETLRKNIEEEAKRFANEELKVSQVPSINSFLNYLETTQTSIRGYTAKETMIASILKKTDSTLNSADLSRDSKYSDISGAIAFNISFLPGFGHQITNAGGNKNTINMNGTAHPIFRSVYEMKKNEISGYNIMAGGQSGKMNSKNYTDQILLWKKGTYKKTQFELDPENLANIINTINFNK